MRSWSLYLDLEEEEEEEKELKESFFDILRLFTAFVQPKQWERLSLIGFGT
jgi:hypothetical protein